MYLFILGKTYDSWYDGQIDNHELERLLSSDSRQSSTSSDVQPLSAKYLDNDDSVTKKRIERLSRPQMCLTNTSESCSFVKSMSLVGF